MPTWCGLTMSQSPGYTRSTRFKPPTHAHLQVCAWNYGVKHCSWCGNCRDFATRTGCSNCTTRRCGCGRSARQRTSFEVDLSIAEIQWQCWIEGCSSVALSGFANLISPVQIFGRSWNSPLKLRHGVEKARIFQSVRPPTAPVSGTKFQYGQSVL